MHTEKATSAVVRLLEVLRPKLDHAALVYPKNTVETHLVMQTLLEKTSVTSQPQQVSRHSKNNHIMLIAEAIEYAETLQISLNLKGYKTIVIHDGFRGLSAIRQHLPNLVLIGWSPLRLTGLEICRRLKASGSPVPMILLTQENHVSQRISGLQAGANDCISPPFIQEELFARIQTNLKNHSTEQFKKPMLQCADLYLNRNTREVFRGNRHIPLTTTEFNLLEYMMEHYFQVLTRAQILQNVWGYDFMGNSNIIEVYVRYLRQKLRGSHDNCLIHTIRGIGYILREPS